MRDDFGIASTSIERAKRYAERFPHLARKIMGQQPVFLNAKETRITVDAKTGERSLEAVAHVEPQPKLKPKVIRRPAPPAVRETTWCNDEGRAALRAAELVHATTQPPRVGEIMIAVADAAGITVAQICGAARPRKFAHPRQVAMYLVSELRKDLSLQKIGFLFGNRDHTTAKHAVDVMPDRLTFNPHLVDIYDRAKEALTAQHKEAA